MKCLSLLVAAVLVSSCTTPYQPTPLPSNPVVVTPPPPSSGGGPAVTPLSVTLSVGVGSPEVGQLISFVASAQASITRAVWSFGNGATATSETGDTAYSYPASGTFTAQVTVTAQDGRTGSDQASVTVSRRAPTPAPPAPAPTPGPDTSGFQVALACAPKPAGSPTPCNVNVTYNGDVQPSERVLAVRWDFGDGFIVDTTRPVASHVYTGAGTYTVFAMVNGRQPEPPDGPGGSDTKTVSTTLTIP